MFRRLIALLMSAALLIIAYPPAYAEDETAEEDVWVDPVLSENAIPWDAKHPELLDESMLYARSAILVESSTGEVLFEKNADEIMYPASTTKILTAYIALQMADLENDVVTISQEAIDLVPPTYAKIPVSAGEEVPIYDLIAATMVRSGNEGANALGEFISGDIYAFGDLMNQTAEMLGCSQDTNFTNPSGAHDPNHFTTVRDMAIIAQAAMKNEDFRKIVRSNTYDMPATDGVNGGRPQRTLVGGTQIINPESESYYYPDCIGVKTGFTNPAGYCFVGAAKRGGIELISVVFYSSRRGRWTDTKKLMEYGFTQIESISPESLYAQDPRVINIAGFSLDDPGHGELTLGIRAVDSSKDMVIVGKKEKIDLLRENFGQVSSIKWEADQFRAPVYAGQVMGTLTFYSEHNGTADYDLVATRSVAVRENAPPSIEEIEAYTAADENPWPRFSWDLLVPPGFLLLILVWLVRFIKRHIKRRPKPPKVETVKKRYLR